LGLYIIILIPTGSAVSFASETTFSLVLHRLACSTNATRGKKGATRANITPYKTHADLH